MFLQICMLFNIALSLKLNHTDENIKVSEKRLPYFLFVVKAINSSKFAFSIIDYNDETVVGGA